MTSEWKIPRRSVRLAKRRTLQEITISPNKFEILHDEFQEDVGDILKDEYKIFSANLQDKCSIISKHNNSKNENAQNDKFSSPSGDHKNLESVNTLSSRIYKSPSIIINLSNSKRTELRNPYRRKV